MSRFHVVLIGTYELGRQPFGLASPVAWLRRAGMTVMPLDLAVQQLEETDPIDHEHGNERGHMYHNLELHAWNFQAEQRLADHQVSGTRYREKFGRSLESTEENGLPNVHPRESASPRWVSMTRRQ